MRPGQRIGDRFEIGDLEHDLLGRGGMGAVCRASDTLSGEIVAVKALGQTSEAPSGRTSEVLGSWGE